MRKSDIDINKNLKRAAVTALSAAAVKAKLLADEEEDQILQLSTSLIEKQVYLPLTSYTLIRSNWPGNEFDGFLFVFFELSFVVWDAWVLQIV